MVGCASLGEGIGVSRAIEVPDEVRAYAEDLHVHTLWARLRRFASYMAARYNGPVYLVGSALRTTDYRDVDIRVVTSDKEFCARYGYDDYNHWQQIGPNQAWIDDVAKRNGEIARDFQFNPDFQVYCASNCIQYREHPRVTLASPTNLDHIAESTRWWDDTDAWLAEQNAVKVGALDTTANPLPTTPEGQER